MRVAVIGAGGFVGQRVARQLDAHPDVDELRLLDRAAFGAPDRAMALQGDFADAGVRARLLNGVDTVILLAAILGGAAEMDPLLARRVNLDATLDLIEHLKGSGTRFVFASTIAVYGTPMPDPVSDETPLAPQMLYGAQKAMIETLLSTCSRRGWLDAVSLRPAGIMARDGVDDGLKSAFLSRLFHAVRRGEDVILPVDAEGRTWLSSIDTVARNFVQAATMPDLGPDRALTLPALSVTFGELVDALRRAFPDSRSDIVYEPDPQTMALFGRFPGLTTATANRLGLARDTDVDALVRNAF